MAIYFWYRFQSTLFFAIGIAAALTLLSMVFGPVDSAFYVIASFLLFLTGNKTNWCILLPTSRKRIVGLHILESFAFTAISTLLMLTVFVRGHVDSDDGLLIFVGVAATFLFRYFLVLKPIAQRQPGALKISKKSQRWLGTYFAFLFCFFILFQQFGSTKIFLMAAVLVAFPFIPFFTVSFPRESLDRGKKALYVSYAVVMMCTIAISTAQVFIWKPTGLTGLGLDFYSGLPITLSKQRSLELLSAPYVDFDHQSIELVGPYIKDMPLRALLDRTKACNDISCVEKSTDYALKRSSSDRFEILKEIIALSQQKKFAELRKSSRGIAMFSKWSADLSSSSILDEWLNGTDVTLQKFAIKALSLNGASDVQLKRIDQLRASDDRGVRGIAELHASYLQDRALENVALCKNKESGCEKYIFPAFVIDK